MSGPLAVRPYDVFATTDLTAYALTAGLPFINVHDNNIVADGVQLTDAAMSVGSPLLNSASASFTVNDIGKLVSVAFAGAAGGTLAGTITGVNSTTQAVLSVNSSANVAGKECIYGTDCAPQINALFAAVPLGYRIVFPNGIYVIGSALSISGRTGTVMGTHPQGARLYLCASLSAGVAMLQVNDVKQFRMETIQLCASRLADYTLWLDFDGVGNIANNWPHFDQVNILEARVEGLRLASSLVNNYPIEIGTFNNCIFAGSTVNVGIHSSNAVRHAFINSRFTWQGSYHQYAPDYNVRIENGGASFVTATADQAALFDIKYELGFLYVDDWYTESHKVIYADAQDPWTYPTTLKNIVHNNGTGGTIAEWYKNGILAVEGCKFGGDFYLGACESGSGRETKFLGSSGFIGTPLALKNFDRPGNRTFVTSNGVQVQTSFVFEITNTAGTLQHRIIADANGGPANMAAATINAISSSLFNTPTVNNVTPFVHGAGINAAATNQIVFDTIYPQFDGYQMFSPGSIETNTTGSNFTYVDWRLSNINVNGVTQQRLSANFKDAAGATKALTTATIPAGTVLRVRFNGWLY